MLLSLILCSALLTSSRSLDITRRSSIPAAASAILAPRASFAANSVDLQQRDSGPIYTAQGTLAAKASRLIAPSSASHYPLPAVVMVHGTCAEGYLPGLAMAAVAGLGLATSLHWSYMCILGEEVAKQASAELRFSNARPGVWRRIPSGAGGVRSAFACVFCASSRAHRSAFGVTFQMGRAV